MRQHDIYLDVIANERKEIEAVDGSKVTFTDGTTMKNPACYHFLGNDTPEPVPENVTVNNGHLEVNGKEIQTGSLYVTGLVARISGNIIVTVTAKGQDNLLELRSYNIEKDRFYKITDPIPTFTSVNVAWKKDDVWVARFVTEIPFSITDEETGEKKEGTQVRDCVAIYDGYNMIREIVPDGPEHLIGNVTKTEDNTIVFASNQELVPFEDTGYVIPKDSEKTYITQLVVYLPNPDAENAEDEEKPYVYVDVYTSVFDGPVRQVTVSNVDNKSLLLVGDRSFMYTNNGHCMRFAPGAEAVKAATMYPHFVRLVVSDSNRSTTKFILANDQYDAVVVTVERTDDRGYVVSVKDAE